MKYLQSRDVHTAHTHVGSRVSGAAQAFHTVGGITASVRMSARAYL